MSKLIFKPENFCSSGKLPTDYNSPMSRAEINGATHCARVAQRLFDEWLDGQEQVYGAPNITSSDPKHHTWSATFVNNPEMTHKARIVCIEPIFKCLHEKLRHLTDTKDDVLDNVAMECAVCGAHVVSTGWKEV